MLIIRVKKTTWVREWACEEKAKILFYPTVKVHKDDVIFVLSTYVRLGESLKTFNLMFMDGKFLWITLPPPSYYEKL